MLSIDVIKIGRVIRGIVFELYRRIRQRKVGGKLSAFGLVLNLKGKG